MSKMLSDLIEKVIMHRTHPVPESEPARTNHLRDLTELEDELVVALNHIGPVIWCNRLWMSNIPARMGPLVEIRYEKANLIAWPPLAVEPMSEKTVGHIPTRAGEV